MSYRCGGTVPSVSGLTITADSTGTATPRVSSSGAASSLAGGAQAVPVTEDPTQPISFEAWAPSGFSPTLTYHIEATGGDNTTIAALETVTVTTESQTITATVTVGFIIDATEIVQVQGNDGFNGVFQTAYRNDYSQTVLSCSCRFHLLQACERNHWGLH